MISRRGRIEPGEGGSSYVAESLGLTLWRDDAAAPHFDAVGVARPEYLR